MISYVEAKHVIETEGARAGARNRTEHVSLLQCIGRYSARETAALDNNPRFDNSAMDGYLVVSAETRSASKDAPVRLRVAGCLAAGEESSGCVTTGSSCIEIMTGARISEGRYDAVIRREDAVEERDQSDALQAILLHGPVEPGENIRYAGDDIRTGEQLFPRGTQLGPQHLMALSMAGYAALDVQVRPKVVVFATGNELVSFDSPPPAATQIRNSTAPLLCSALTRYGVEVLEHRVVCDKASAIRHSILAALEQRPDMIITTGGVSVGKFDLVPAVLHELGATIHFHKVAVRPGKPVLFGRFAHSGPAFFGLPGNPIAVAAVTRFFIRPYLRALFGEGTEIPHRLPLTQNVGKPAGLLFFQRGLRDGQGVMALAKQASFMVRSLLDAEGWVVGDPGPKRLQQGELVDWYPLW